jgi:hypothetical protein
MNITLRDKYTSGIRNHNKKRVNNVNKPWSRESFSLDLAIERFRRNLVKIPLNNKM